MGGVPHVYGGLGFVWVRLYASFGDHKAQEFSYLYAKLAPSQIQMHIVVLDNLQDIL